MTASAQFDNSFGIKAGANYSYFRSDRDIFEGKIGYYAGGYFNFGISDKISLRPELLFANQGTRTYRQLNLVNPDASFHNNEFLVNWNETVLLLPIDFRYELVRRLFVEAGPQVGYAINRTEIIKESNIDPSMEGQKLTYTDFDRFDFGVNVGVGVDMTAKLELCLRYSHGLIKRDVDYKTSVFSLGFGFKI